MRFDLSSLPNDAVLLQRMVREAVEAMEQDKAALTAARKTVETQAALIEKLTLQIDRFTRGRYGRSSEQQNAAQLRLIFESGALPASSAEANDNATPEAADDDKDRRPRRRIQEPLPLHLPRRAVSHLPETMCQGSDDGAECPGQLVRIGEDVTEVLDYIPARFEVVKHVRPRLACRRCEKVFQAPVPSLPIPKAKASATLLAHILVSRFQDHLPYYRQAAIFGRSGIDLDRNVMVEWAGRIAWLLQPVVDRMGRYVFSAAKIHGDDTPVRVLDPGSGKTKTGRLWVYLRHDRSSGDPGPPAVVLHYTEDRSGVHPERHLKDYKGYFQADAFSGFNRLYRDPRTGAPTAIVEVGCWSHVRRKFHDVHEATQGQSPVAAEALVRIGELYEIERQIKGLAPGERLAVRQREAAPRLAALKCWFEAQAANLAPKGAPALAIHYALRRWPALVRYCGDDRLEAHNNLVENALRGVSLGRKNWLFAGSDRGGERAALFYSLIETCKLNGLDAEAYLADVIGRIGDHPINRIDELLPWVWATNRAAGRNAAA